MTATDIRDYFSDPNIVAEIVRELNMEIGFCPILRNLKREKDCGVIDDESISFRELGAEDRNEVFVYLGRILESVLTCQLSKCDSFDVKKDRSSSGDVTSTDVFGRSKVHLARTLGLVLLTPPRKKTTRWTLSASNMD